MHPTLQRMTSLSSEGSCNRRSSVHLLYSPQHLIERSWYAVLETFILLAAFHQELSVGFVTMITLLFVVKAFHWLAGDRVDYVSACVWW